MVTLPIGLEINYTDNIENVMQTAQHEGLFKVVLPLFPPDSSIEENYNIQRSDLLIETHTWASSVIGVLPLSSSNRQGTVSDEEKEKLFIQHLSWAVHLSVSATVLPLAFMEWRNYASIVNRYLLKTQHMEFCVRLPLQATEGTEKEAENEINLWKEWHRFRNLCDSHTRLGVALEVTADLPSSTLLDRWLGEPIKCVIIPTSIFLTNAKGYPTLSRKHQQFILQLMDINKKTVQFILTGESYHHKREDPMDAEGEPLQELRNVSIERESGVSVECMGSMDSMEATESMESTGNIKGYHNYVQYMNYLYNARLPPVNLDEKRKWHNEAPYYDYLQIPLQPLMDDLESQTYETFERDPIKYREYEKAMIAALKDQKKIKQEEQSTNKTNEPIVMAVAGAGRGPLVRCALCAAAITETEVFIYVVEKNLNAVITLKNLQRQEQWENVQIVSGDMRECVMPQSVDILISELLGSFGDNELSPDCLDNIVGCLRPKTGISIPASYRTYASPISACKVWNDAKAFESRKNLETPYVVKLRNFYQLAKPQLCWSFHHQAEDPSKKLEKTKGYPNRRECTLTFQAEEDSSCHGFVGYFDAQLYKDVSISILPATHSIGMFSWFPIYFPIKEPLYIQKNETVTISIWRMQDTTKVWYEWTMDKENGEATPIHNPNGRSYWIGL